MATEGRRVTVAGAGVLPLGGWELVRTLADAAARPEDLEPLRLEWAPAQVPGTVASSLVAEGRWSFEDNVDFDEHDWWYRCRFHAEPTPDEARVLRFGGIATVADAWLNGSFLLHSANMFLAHERDVTAILRDRNELLVRCRSLHRLLDIKRPRARWRTRLVERQQLRWFRTSLLGRMPGWTPPAAPVGLWRDVTLAEAPSVAIESADIGSRVDGAAGVVLVALKVRTGSRAVLRAELHVGSAAGPLAVEADGAGALVAGSVRVEDAVLWWPHTHGAQPRYSVRVTLHFSDGDAATINCGQVGFRTIEAETADGGFSLRVNGVPVFCRGACWTPLDVVRLTAHEREYREALELARDAGMNMIRVSGTMVYEQDEFYEWCDKLGIMVWQDFMFANLDYPSHDDAFATSVREEATQLLQRLQGRPSIAVLCGGSEVEQQAAMLGLPRESWSGPLFQDVLPGLAERLVPGVPYVTSSPSGGTLPFQANRGVTHYYGVGAYLRPLEDARRAEVRFASECLAFANVPEPRTIEELLAPGESPAHHPRWKRRVPRDVGAGWDFEDVRDHYVGRLFGVDPLAVRSADMERYLALGRVASGEVMAATIADWRRARSPCRGALVFLLRDLWPGAGWGVIDSRGRPKAAYYYLKRAMQPVALLATDEGVNGLALHAVNDTASRIPAELRVELFRNGDTPVGSGTASVSIPARAAVEFHADALFDGFRDITYAYRFGPPGHDLTVATLLDPVTGAVLAQAFAFPGGLSAAVEPDVGLSVEPTHDRRGWSLSVSTRRFAQSVALEIAGFRPADNYFHLAPGATRSIRLAGLGGGIPSGSAIALNGRASAILAMEHARR